MLTLEEVMADDQPAPLPKAPKPQSFSFEDVAGRPAEEAPGPTMRQRIEGSWNQLTGWIPEPDPNEKPADTFPQRVVQTLKTSASVGWKHPVQTAKGTVKAAASVVVDTGELILSGLSGLASAAASRATQTGPMVDGQEMMNSFENGVERAHEQARTARDFWSRITGINIQPDRMKQESAAMDLLALYPDGVHALGETAFEKLGYASVAAGIEGLGAVLPFSPKLAAGMFGGAAKVFEKAQGFSDRTAYRPGGEPPGGGPRKPSSAKPSEGDFTDAEIVDTPARQKAKEGGQVMLDSLAEAAVANKPLADAVVDHVSKGDASLGAKLKAHVEKAAKATPEQQVSLGEKIGKAKIKSREDRLAQAKAKLYAEEAVRKGLPPEQAPAAGKAMLVEHTPQTSMANVAGQQVKTVKPSVARETYAVGDKQKIEALKDAAWMAWQKGKTDIGGVDMRALSSAKRHGVKFKDREDFGGYLDRVHERMAPLNKFNRTLAQVEINNGLASRRDGLNDAAGELFDRLNVNEPPAGFGTEDPIIYKAGNGSTTFGDIAKGLRFAESLAGKSQRGAVDIAGLEVVAGKIRSTVEYALENGYPELRGPEARTAAAVVSSGYAKITHDTAMRRDFSQTRREYWLMNGQNNGTFIRAHEGGMRQADPLMQGFSDAYKTWKRNILAQDARIGYTHDSKEGWMSQVFKDQPLIEDWGKRTFPQWGQPRFMSDRMFSINEAAARPVSAGGPGFRLKYTNLEDLMQARQAASDIAEMKVTMFDQLEQYGLAHQFGRGAAPGFTHEAWTSPNGKRYWVSEIANPILHNAFNTKGLWENPNPVGDAFRAAMYFKNSTVPILLSFSLFHPMHIMTIHNSTSMMRASKALASGTMNPMQWTKEMLTSAMYFDTVKDSMKGYRTLQILRGKQTAITNQDRMELQFMIDGGMMPQLSEVYRTNAKQKLRDAAIKAVREANNGRPLAAIGYGAQSVWHLPYAIMESINKPIFEMWIPMLKTASYLQDVKTAIQTNPQLLNDTRMRQEAFHRLAKSVDDRYGEMNYQTLFMNRMVKDIGVLSTVSMGWQLGFIRGHGGGMIQTVATPVKGGKMVDKIAKGDYDKAMYWAFNVTNGLALACLTGWALSGEMCEAPIDYFFPKAEPKQPDGSQKRLNTFHYNREYWALYAHMQEEGIVGGLGKTAYNKGSGVFGSMTQFITGFDSFGNELNDPNAPAYQALAQRVAGTLGEFEPIALESILSSETSAKEKALAGMGLGAAPKYVTATATEAAIKHDFLKYNTRKHTPYEKVIYGKGRKELRTAYESDDGQKYEEKLEKLTEQFELSDKEVRRLRRDMEKDIQPTMRMFQSLGWQQQKKIMDKMSPEELEIYQPHSNKDHLRDNYTPPGER